MMKRTEEWIATVVTVAFVIAVMLWMAACQQSQPMAADPAAPSPGTTLNPIVIQYDINIPFPDGARDLATQFPHGLMTAPVTAQATFDFTDVYGRPNVYFGTIAPPVGTYTTGIVVAPLAAAGHDQFLARDWPAGCGGFTFKPETVCAWLGHFTYAQPGNRP